MVAEIDGRDVTSLVSNLRRKALVAREEARAIVDTAPLTARLKLEARAVALEDAARVVARWARRRGLRR